MLKHSHRHPQIHKLQLLSVACVCFKLTAKCLSMPFYKYHEYTQHITSIPYIRMYTFLSLTQPWRPLFIIYMVCFQYENLNGLCVFGFNSFQLVCSFVFIFFAIIAIHAYVAVFSNNFFFFCRVSSTTGIVKKWFLFWLLCSKQIRKMLI